MTKGPNRLILDTYLDSSAPGLIKSAGTDWKGKAKDLLTLSEALGKAARQAELRIGEQTLTGPAVRASMEESATSLATKSEQLHAAGEALSYVGQQLADTREKRDQMADIGPQPAPYQPPAGTPGVEPTSEELKAQADASQARQSERSAWQTQYDKQEARSLALTKDMDSAFLSSIPPMKDIHGQEDPTEPPPQVPSGPGGTYLPGTQVPTGGGGGGDDDKGEWLPRGPRGTDEPDRPDRSDDTTPVVIGCDLGPRDPDTGGPEIGDPDPGGTRIGTPTIGGPEAGGPASTTVTGTTQSGVSYTSGGSGVSTPSASSPGGVSAGSAMGAAGMAGAAGAISAGGLRGGSAPAATGRSSSAPVRAIGSTGRAGGPGALTRTAGSAAGSTAGRGAAGSPASRSAGSSAGGPASRSAGSASGRGSATGGSSSRGGAGGRGGATGAGAGSRSGTHGSGGARGAATGAGAGAGGSRGGRTGERDQATDRDGLVYDQDWLGDDDIAPGILD